MSFFGPQLWFCVFVRSKLMIVRGGASSGTAQQRLSELFPNPQQMIEHEERQPWPLENTKESIKFEENRGKSRVKTY